LIALGNRPHTLNERIANAKHDADQLLNHIEKKLTKAPKTLVDFVKFIQELAIEALKHLISEDWQKAVEDLH